jgi:hypothetical protein
MSFTTSILVILHDLMSSGSLIWSEKDQFDNEKLRHVMDGSVVQSVGCLLVFSSPRLLVKNCQAERCKRQQLNLPYPEPNKRLLHPKSTCTCPEISLSQHLPQQQSPPRSPVVQYCNSTGYRQTLQNPRARKLQAYRGTGATQTSIFGSEIAIIPRMIHSLFLSYFGLIDTPRSMVAHFCVGVAVSFRGRIEALVAGFFKRLDKVGFGMFGKRL